MVMTALQARIAPAAPASPQDDLVAYLRAALLAAGADREQCHVLFLDAQRCFLGEVRIASGGHDALCLRMRGLFVEALRLDARGLVLAHNHPSGHCRPSGCDIAATRRLAEIAAALDIELVDHLIMTRTSAYSMRAGGLL